MFTITFSENHGMRRMRCQVFGHHFITTRTVTAHFKERKCLACGIEITNDLTGKAIPLTKKQKEINDALYQLYQKRHT